MTRMKRCISLLLVLGILLGVLVPATQAAPVEETEMMNTDNATTEGRKVLTNPLGTYEGHTYVLFDGEVSSWDDAREFCESLGGHLATITSAEENAFLYDYMQKCGYANAYWGLTDQSVEGVWEWCTGEPVTYINWASGEPNNDYDGKEDYGMFWDEKPGGVWNDGIFGDDGLAFLCEWDCILLEARVVYNNHAYQLMYADVSSWEDAQAYCESLGGHLATITSVEENDFIYSYIVECGHRNAYFGLTDKYNEGAWEWCNGEAVTYTNWPKDQPSDNIGRENYGMYWDFYSHGEWNDGDFNKNYPFICEWDTVEINTSIHTTMQNYSDDDLILIYPVEPNSLWNLTTTLSDVTVSSSLGESVPPKGGFFIHRADASAREMILSKDGYRDYILPAEVTRTMRGKKRVAYTLTAYMHKDQKDGKPYISTVFGRESDGDKTYTDLLSTPLVARADSGCDVIVTAVGFGDQAVTYYLAQDSKRKVSSTSGVFTNEQLYDIFDDTSTVYAYAVGSDGRQTEPITIKVNREEKLDLEKELGFDSEISLLGKDFFKLKISDDIPVLGGMELDMSAFTFPVGISAEGDEMKISLGVDLFSSTDSDEGYKWKTFKDMIITDADIDLKDLETFCNVYDLAQGHSWMKSQKANTFNVNVLGFVEGKWINGEFVIKEGQINFGGNFKLQYNAQGAVWVVPVYGSVEAGADFGVGGKVTRFLPDRDIPFEFTMLLNVAPKVKGGAGAGIKGAVSAGLYAEGKLPLMIAFQEEHFTLDLEGELGVEGELFLLHGKKALLDGDTNLINWYYGTSYSPSAASHIPGQKQTKTVVVSRDYAENTSAWLGDRGPALSIQSVGTKTTASRGVTFRGLQTSIFSNSQPQLVTVGDQMLLVWVQDDASRDTYNRMRLVYSVYDSQGDRWSDPLPVWDDGHNDGYPVLASDGSQAYVLWQKVNTTLTAENTTDIDTTIENSELCLARFDADTGAFVDAQMLTENDLYEYAHNVVLENGEPVVYWAAAEGNAMNTSGTNALYCWINSTISAFAQDLNYVLSIDASDDDVTYVADVDGDLSSTEDVTATTISGSGTEVFDNSELGTAVMYAGYAPMEGESVLFLSDMRNIYYTHNSEVKSVLEESRTMDGNLNIVETDHGVTIIWTETVDGWNEIYAVMYEDGKWSAPAMISENGKLLTKISATSYDGKLVGVSNANAVTYDEASEEYVKGETDLLLFQTNDFSDIALANYLNINENELEAGVDTAFSVTVYNNGTNSADEVTFTVTDTLGTKSIQTVTAAIPSGGSETITLIYPVPDGYTTTTLTVTASIADSDVNESDNSISRTIGNPDLTVTETAVEIHSDGYKITAIVENGSLVDAKNIIISAFADEEKTELLRFETIGTISRENYAFAEILVKEDRLSYSENGTAKIYLKLDAYGEEASGADNTLCVVVTEDVETVCMHPATELAAKLEPTCTEPGYEAYEICNACGETVGEITVIPASGHEWVNSICVNCGVTIENPFIDVPEGSFYYEPVMWAVENGVTAGTSETTFDPSGLCLRAHVVTFLYRAAGSPVPSSTKNPFTDVKSGDFYYNPVLWAVENGITQGISKTQFGSTQVCNRAAVVTFLWRAFGSPEPKSTNHPFVDVKSTDFFYKPVLWAVENGITAGIDATHFNPAGACNRAQVVTFLYRAYN